MEKIIAFIIIAALIITLFIDALWAKKIWVVSTVLISAVSVCIVPMPYSSCMKSISKSILQYDMKIQWIADYKQFFITAIRLLC